MKNTTSHIAAPSCWPMTVPAIRWDSRPSPLEGSVAERFCQCKLSRFRAPHARGLDPWVDTGSRQETRQNKNPERSSVSIRPRPVREDAAPVMPPKAGPGRAPRAPPARRGSGG
jgi:hypothetical protein